MSALNLSAKSGPWPTIILVLLTAGLTLLLVTMAQQCSRPTPTGQAPDSLMYHLNQLHQEVASLRGAEPDFGVQVKRITDSLAKVYGAKIKDLKEYIIADLQTHAEVPVIDGSQHYEYLPPTIIKGDTCPPQIRNIAAGFESPYYHADAQLGEDPYLKIIGFDTLTVLWRDTTIGRFFNRKKYLQLDVHLANPDTRVTGLRAFRIPKSPPKQWALGVQLGYGIMANPRTGKAMAGAYLGLGITKTLLRF